LDEVRNVYPRLLGRHLDNGLIFYLPCFLVVQKSVGVKEMCIENSGKREEKQKMVKVGDSYCMVETLREWLNWRITTIRMVLREHGCNISFCGICRTDEGRLSELLIVREKINDGRIQEIG